ncbi:MAG: hypothetical protein EYC70_04520 [Planctomycetota bacterium]|nr:MAG: hypothetical protein EYC70_04520 [Planctomycetota bacterium]
MTRLSSLLVAAGLVLGTTWLLAPAAANSPPASGHRPAVAAEASYLSLPLTVAWSAAHGARRDPGDISVSRSTNGSFCSVGTAGGVATRQCTSGSTSTCSVGTNTNWSNCSVNANIMGAQCSATSAFGFSGFCSVSANRPGSHCSTFVATKRCSSIAVLGGTPFCSVIQGSGAICTTFNSTQVQCSAWTLGAQCSVRGQPNSTGPCQG